MQQSCIIYPTPLRRVYQVLDDCNNAPTLQSHAEEEEEEEEEEDEEEEEKEEKG